MAEVVIHARTDAAQEGVTKLRAAGCSVTLYDPTRSQGALKDSDIRKAGVVVVDAEFATPAFRKRMAQFATPTVVVGTRRVSWENCLRPVIAAMREQRASTAAHHRSAGSERLL